MPNGHRYAGSEGSSADHAEAWRSPGKRTLTDSIQRKAAESSVHPLAPVPPSVAQAEPNGLSCEQSFLDSILDGPVQRKADGEASVPDVHALAEAGTAGAGGSLPFLHQIQASFGAHDVSGIAAHTDGAAASAAQGMGATAYATGNDVAFAGAPDLHTAAHEAAHVVQQRAGVHLKGGVGEAGDAYEQHADAVADAVVRGESAEALLGVPADGGNAAVQQEAVQREMDLGPAGRPAGGPPAPEPGGPRPGPGALGTATKLGGAALPHIKFAMDQITMLKGVWDLLKPGGGKGEVKELPEQISPVNKINLDRVIRFAVATKFIDEMMSIGKRFGIDFTTWDMGMPPPEPAPAAPAAPAVAPTDPAAEPAVEPAAPATTEPAAPAAVKPATAPPREVPAAAQALISAIQSLAIEDLKDRAVQELQSSIAANTKRQPLISFWWNGANMRGMGDPPKFMGDWDTWGMITWHVVSARVTPGTSAGIPIAARHFGITPRVDYMTELAWFAGGRVEIDTHEDSFDDISVKTTEVSPAHGVAPPIGAIHMGFAFAWDDEDTTLDVDVILNPQTMNAGLTNVDPRGEPET